MAICVPSVRIGSLSITIVGIICLSPILGCLLTFSSRYPPTSPAETKIFGPICDTECVQTQRVCANVTFHACRYIYTIHMAGVVVWQTGPVYSLHITRTKREISYLQMATRRTYMHAVVSHALICWRACCLRASMQQSVTTNALIKWEEKENERGKEEHKRGYKIPTHEQVTHVIFKRTWRTTAS